MAVVTLATRRPFALAIVALAACLLAGGIATAPAFLGPTRAQAPQSGDACIAAFGAGDSWLHLPARGRDRQVLLHIPASLSADRPVPLLIAVHGWASGAAAFAPVTGLNTGADERGVVVAYPHGLGSPAGWHVAGLPSTDRGIRQADLALFDALMDRLTGSGCIDPARVFVAGHSQGGGMAGDLACQRAERLAGVTMISGEHFVLPCAPSRPIAIVSLHAIDDEVLPYRGGRVTMGPDLPPVLPAEEVAAAWAALDGCGQEMRHQDVSPNATRVTWEGCAAPVVFYRMRTGAHAWAASTSTTGVTATDLAWSLVDGAPER